MIAWLTERGRQAIVAIGWPEWGYDCGWSAGRLYLTAQSPTLFFVQHRTGKEETGPWGPLPLADTITDILPDMAAVALLRDRAREYLTAAGITFSLPGTDYAIDRRGGAMLAQDGAWVFDPQFSGRWPDYDNALIAAVLATNMNNITPGRPVLTSSDPSRRGAESAAGRGRPGDDQEEEN
ncbi:MAG: hypothetical protein IMZ62_12975 [Chloroflexi bacterium]|nr:hypothetical protein [Chloroflexota bacterium]MBE3118191.1 hypothetical protein [Candidatus Atribacteria bacterium]